MSAFSAISAAIQDLHQGRMIILVDDEHREQEGDLVIAAEKVTPDAINFMTKYARGIICLTLAPSIVDRLELPLLPSRNSHKDQAAFTVSIEAANGISSGVSTYDRAHTIQAAIKPNSSPADISYPGHVFPLRARAGGVLERAGHTEGSVDLVALTGLQPAAVICEVMCDDGTMARLPDLELFSQKHQIKLISIQDLIEYRLAQFQPL
jgi:3,4-dihydroxy 2-butanone 4-phosphate synthase / GTP cyclohydrolase II